MLILALDTTTRGGSVAVVDDTGVLALVNGDDTRTHAERLPGEIERALTAAAKRPADVDLLAVASGPGAFTGLRIGLAAVQGIAMVLRKPVVGVSALDALAAETARTKGVQRVATWMDARRGEVFAACYRMNGEVRPLESPVVAAPTVVLRKLPFSPAESLTFAGDGARRYAETIREVCGDRASIVTEAVALAPALARLGRQLALAGGAGPPHALQPLYVRRSDAELDRDRKAGHD